MYLVNMIAGPSKSFSYLLILAQLKKAKPNKLDLNNHILPLMFSTFTDIKNFLAGEQIFNTQCNNTNNIDL